MRFIMWVEAIGVDGKLEVTECGRVRSVDRMVDNWPKGERMIIGRELKGSVSKAGYKQVDLRSRAKSGETGKVHFLHRIIARTFLIADDGEDCVNHIDGNKLNNSVSNLEWCTKAYNNKHAWRTGLCDNQKKPVLSHNGKGEGNWYPSLRSPIGCNPSLIHAAMNGGQKTHRGLYWEYAQ
jgi:hypothetical protein